MFKLLVQIEGTDRVGKTTVASELERLLKTKFSKVKVQPFPYRKTEIGTIIDKMLHMKTFKWHEAVIFQLLQTANRLEFYEEIKKWEADNNAVLIFDRYVLSGLVYGKLDGVPFDFLLELQLLLPPPQLTVILTADEPSLSRRLKEKKDIEVYETIQHTLDVQKEYIPVTRKYLELAEKKYEKSFTLLEIDNSDGKLSEAVETIYFTILKVSGKI